MKIVVDTNIIFSALLREDNKYANALIKNIEGHNYFAVYFTFDDILEGLYAILKQIHVINDELISVASWKEAVNLLHDIDIKDVPNFALLSYGQMTKN